MSGCRCYLNTGWFTFREADSSDRLRLGMVRTGRAGSRQPPGVSGTRTLITSDRLPGRSRAATKGAAQQGQSDADEDGQLDPDEDGDHTEPRGVR
jgi:hypothetical protein